MNNKQQTHDPKRRGFLVAAGLGGAGAVAAVTVASSQPLAPVATAPAEPPSGQYAETAHIHNYYRTARV